MDTPQARQAKKDLDKAKKHTDSRQSQYKPTIDETEERAKRVAKAEQDKIAKRTERLRKAVDDLTLGER